MNTLDRVILEQYVLFDTPADQIVSDPNVSAVFRDAVNQHLGDGEQVDVCQLNKRILSLRKRGEANGGLPRLRRSYSGRNQ